MRVIVAGSRQIEDYAVVEGAITVSGIADHITEIVSGAARGVDLSGEAWAYRRGIPVARYPANWGKEGRKAGVLRNKVMADYADALIAVWDGRSPGTRNMIAEMEDRAKPVFTYRTDAVYGIWNQHAHKMEGR